MELGWIAVDIFAISGFVICLMMMSDRFEPITLTIKRAFLPRLALKSLRPFPKLLIGDTVALRPERRTRRSDCRDDPVRLARGEDAPVCPVEFISQKQ